MRGHPPRTASTITAAVLYVIIAAAYTSSMIIIGHRTDPYATLPWIAAGWIVTAGAGAWYIGCVGAELTGRYRPGTRRRPAHTRPADTRPPRLRDVNAIRDPHRATPDEIRDVTDTARMLAAAAAGTGDTGFDAHTRDAFALLTDDMLTDPGLTGLMAMADTPPPAPLGTVTRDVLRATGAMTVTAPGTGAWGYPPADDR